MSLPKILYYKLLKERAVESGERHHIVPKHDGGKDSDGLVKLSRKDHTLAHYIRYRWLKQPGDYLAYRMMQGQKENPMNIQEYREKHIKAVRDKSPEWRYNIGSVRRGKTFEELYGDNAEEQKRKRSRPGKLNGMYGKKHSKETLSKIRKSKSNGIVILITPQDEQIHFESKEAMVRYGINAQVINNNMNKGYISRGKWKNYQIKTK